MIRPLTQFLPFLLRRFKRSGDEKNYPDFCLQVPCHRRNTKKNNIPGGFEVGETIVLLTEFN